MTQEEIKETLLNIIKNKLNKKKEIIVREEEAHEKEKSRLYSALEKLESFEKKHINELREIYEECKNYYNDGSYRSYLFSPINQIVCLLGYYEDIDEINYRNRLPDEEQYLFFGSKDYVYITYKEFEKNTGFTLTTIKNNLNALSLSGKIKINKIMGGLEYKIL